MKTIVIDIIIYDIISEFYLVVPIVFSKYNVLNNSLAIIYHINLHKYLMFTTFSNRSNHKTKRSNSTHKYEIIIIYLIPM